MNRRLHIVDKTNRTSIPNVTLMIYSQTCWWICHNLLRNNFVFQRETRTHTAKMTQECLGKHCSAEFINESCLPISPDFQSRLPAAQRCWFTQATCPVATIAVQCNISRKLHSYMTPQNTALHCTVLVDMSPGKNRSGKKFLLTGIAS